MENPDYRDAHRQLIAAQLDLDDAKQTFVETASGVASALDVSNELELLTESEEISDFLMKTLRNTAQRHAQAADLVSLEDVEELKTQLKQEATLWVGEGGDEFNEHLKRVDYQEQPKQRAPSSGASAPVSPRSDAGGVEDFSPLDKVHDVVLNIREDEIRCFFEDEAPEEELTHVTGIAQMSLATLRHMAEESADEIPIFSVGAEHEQVGTLAVDIVPLAEDGSFPPFAEPTSPPEEEEEGNANEGGENSKSRLNPFVTVPDELLSKTIQFAIRVRSVEFEEEKISEYEQKVLSPRMRSQIPQGATPPPPSFFVRYRLPAEFRPTSIETHRSVESGITASPTQTFNHVAQWQYLVDEEFLEMLSSATIQFEIVAASTWVPNASSPTSAEEKAKEEEEAEQQKSPKTLKELLEIRAKKHEDLKRRHEAEILREVTEIAKQKEEREEYAKEYRAAFQDDCKHIKRSIEKLREMLKEGLHHKNRGTAKQMTVEHAMDLKERRMALRRKQEEKVYNTTHAQNHLKEVELQNLSSELINLRNRKISVLEHYSGVEEGALEKCKTAEEILSRATNQRNAFTKELKEISHIRGEVNLSHTHLRKMLLGNDNNSINGSETKRIADKKKKEGSTTSSSPNTEERKFFKC